MTDTISITNLQHRCRFLSHETVKLAFLRSYIADITLQSDRGSLTFFELPAALFFLNVIEECALASIRGTAPTAWPIPETDESLLISTKNDLLYIEAAADGVSWRGMQSFHTSIDKGISLFYQSFRELVLPDRESIEQLGAKIIDNPVIRHVFDYRYI